MSASIDSFPWKTRLADVSCYTLEVRSGTERSGRDKSVAGLKSQLKASRVVFPRTVLDMVTTSITLSVVTKSLEIKTFKKPETKAKQTEHKEEEVMFYIMFNLFPILINTNKYLLITIFFTED